MIRRSRFASSTVAVGRAALSALFIGYGIDGVRDPVGRAEMTADAGLPAATTLVRLTCGGFALAGATLALGVRPRLSAGALAALMVPTTLVGHAFWKVEDPDTRGEETAHFLKNLAIFGGLVVLAASTVPARPADA